MINGELYYVVDSDEEASIKHIRFAGDSKIFIRAIGGGEDYIDKVYDFNYLRINTEDIVSRFVQDGQITIRACNIGPMNVGDAKLLVLTDKDNLNNEHFSVTAFGSTYIDDTNRFVLDRGGIEVNTNTTVSPEVQDIIGSNTRYRGIFRFKLIDNILDSLFSIKIGDSSPYIFDILDITENYGGFIGKDSFSIEILYENSTGTGEWKLTLNGIDDLSFTGFSLQPEDLLELSVDIGENTLEMLEMKNQVFKLVDYSTPDPTWSSDYNDTDNVIINHASQTRIGEYEL